MPEAICLGANEPATDRRAGEGTCVVCLTRQQLTTAARERDLYPVLHRANVPSGTNSDEEFVTCPLSDKPCIRDKDWGHPCDRDENWEYECERKVSGA